MCLNLPFEVKNQLTFYKVRWLKYTFYYSVYPMPLEFLRLCKYSFTNSSWVQHIFWSSKILFCFWIEPYFFFKWSYSQRCENRRWKWQRCSIQCWNTQPCFNVVERCKFKRWRTQRCFNVVLTLCDVATSYQPKNNVEPTLKCLLGQMSKLSKSTFVDFHWP